MRLSRLLGRRMPVDYAILQNLRVAARTEDGRTLLVVSGTMMESARVFDSLGVAVAGRTISLTIFASLVFWRRGGSPDFDVTREVALSPGTYEVRYVGPDRATTSIQRLKVGEDDG
jgi:hypothetical protein